MAAYDSDSSLDDDVDYTLTNVMLGYASVDPSDDDISHIGGQPTWIDSNITPSAALAKCKVCNGYLSLLLQLNADLQQHFPQNTRRIHVWYCKNKTCSRKQGSVRTFREVKKPRMSRQVKSSEPAPTQQKPVADLGSALFGGSPTAASGNINPFSQNASAQGAPPNPFSSLAGTASLAAKPPQNPVAEPQPLTETFAEKLSLDPTSSETKSARTIEAWPEISAFPDPFSYFYLDACAEELEPVPAVTDAAASSSRTQYDADDSGSAAAAAKDTSDMNIDKTFQKFSDIVSQNPEQILRYEFKGQPLLYSGTDGVASRFVVPHGKAGAVKGLPHCDSCGAQRVFEFQLTPHLIFEIEKNEAMSIEDGMEWGTIIVGTCINNCGENGTVSFQEEWVGVQWEERMPKK